MQALKVLARALEADPSCVVLWIVYLHIYYSNQKSIGKDDMFHCAVCCQISYLYIFKYYNTAWCSLFIHVTFVSQITYQEHYPFTIRSNGWNNPWLKVWLYLLMKQLFCFRSQVVPFLWDFYNNSKDIYRDYKTSIYISI